MQHPIDATLGVRPIHAQEAFRIKRAQLVRDSFSASLSIDISSVAQVENGSTNQPLQSGPFDSTR